MTITAAGTAATWIMVLVAATGILLAFFVNRVAAKVFAAVVAALIVLIVFAVRDHIVDLGSGNIDALCAGRVSFFGIDLRGGTDQCPTVN